MQKIIKITCMLLVFVLMFGLFTGCKKEKTNSNVTTVTMWSPDGGSKVVMTELVKKFNRLEMNDTTFNPTEEIFKKMAVQYNYDKEKCKLINCGKSNVFRFKFGTEYESGGAGCISSVEDYIKFLEAIRTYKLIKKETVDLMQTDMLTEKIRDKYFFENYKNLGYSYGLGVRVPAAFQNGVDDFGWSGAGGMYVVIDTKNEITAFYAQHVYNNHIDDAKHTRAEIGKLLKDILVDKA